MMRLLRLLWSMFWAVFAVAVIGAAVVLSLVRLLLPLAQDYREEIAAWVSASLGQEVHIAGLDAQWRGLRPVLQLHGVNVTGNRYGRVEIETVDVTLGFSFSQHRLRLIPTNLLLTHPQLTLPTVVGGEASPGPWPFAGFAEMGPGRVVVRDAQVCAVEGTLRGCLVGDAYLHSDGQRLRGAADLRLPASWGGSVHLALDALAGHEGEWYLETKGLRLLPIAHRWFPGVVLDGAADVRLWGNLGQSRVEGVVDRLLLQTGDVNQGLQSLVLTLDGFSWQREASDWQLDVANLRRLGATAAGATFQVRVAGAAGARALWLRADRLSLPEMAFLAGVDGLLPGNVATTFAALSPRGQLADLQLHMPLAGDAPTDTPARDNRILEVWNALEVQLHFTGLSLRPWQTIPGVENLSGGIQIAGGTGVLDFDDKNGRLYLASLFRDPWPVERFTGSVTLQGDPLGWRFSTSQLTLATPSLDLEMGGTLFIPALASGLSPRLDMDGRLLRADGKDLALYLPRRVMPYPAVTWLDRSILGGKVSQGVFHLHGNLADFPFDHGEGRFTVDCRVTGGELNYDHDWPPLHALDLNLGFHGRAMEIQVHGGRILESALEPTTAVIPDLDHEPPLLQVRGQVRGPMADIPRLIQESPLARRYGQYVATLDGRGMMALALELDMHTKPVEIKRVAGHLNLQKADLHWRDPEVTVEAATGVLGFSAEGIRGEKIIAKVFGLPVELALQSETKGSQPATVIDVRGQVGTADLGTRLSPALLRHLRGRTTWQATVTLPEIPPGGKALPSVRVVSNLQGMVLSLPAPFAKTAGQTAALSLETALGGDQHELRLGYGTEANALVSLDKDAHLTRGVIRLGKNALTLPMQPEFQASPSGTLRLHADLANMVLGDWLDFAVSLAEKDDAAKDANTNKAAAERAKPPDLALDAKIGNLRVGEHDFHDVEFAAGKGKDGWDAHFTAQESVGRLHWSLDSGLDLDLERLTLLEHEGAAVEADAEEGSRTDPRSLPPLRFRCADLHLGFVSKGEVQSADAKAHEPKGGEMPLGRLEITTRPDRDGLTVTGLHLRSPTLQVEGKGYWRVTGGMDEAESSFDLTSETQNLGNALNAMGYAGTVEGGAGKAKLHATWPGSPGAFAVGRLSGALAIEVEKGRLVQVNPGGTGRMFGLLSLHALPRRLAFDFSDVFRKGLSFDRMSGDFRIERGDAFSKNLELHGPAADIAVDGRTGLANHDYDQVVTVTPNVSGTLPWAGVLAAGSVGVGVGVGAAIMLAQHLLQPGIDRIAQFRYALHGPWDNPIVEPLHEGSAGENAQAAPEPK